jgi:hypothetical protein
MTEIKNFCEKHRITENQFFGKEIINGSLDLLSLTEIPEGFNPTVGRNLDLESLKEIPKGFNPTVGWNLYLNSLTEIPEGFNPTVGRNLDLESLTEIPKGFNPTVGWNLYLNSLTEIPEGFNPTVGITLYLNSLTEIPKGFNPTVGGDLFLNSLKQIPEGFNRSDYEDKNISLFEWDNHIKCDNRFSEVISKKGNVWKLKDICKDKIYYLVTDGNGNYAHGDTIKEAKDDLIYKISNRDVSQYQNIDLNKKFSFTECITMYRSITGSCSTGVRNFIETNGIKKQSYSVNDIIGITKNNYGNESFNKFFK